MRLDETIAKLRSGTLVRDYLFDDVYPAQIRALSSRHWTPVEVARRAAQMLVSDGSTRVLDVGSGSGKFCLVGALTTPGSFVGVERRRDLVDIARGIAQYYDVPRASYQCSDIRDVNWPEFDGFYFYNPFAESRFVEQPANGPVFPVGQFDDDVRFATEALTRAAIGTRVVTYHGLGSDLPAGYEQRACEILGSDVLELWVHVRRAAGSAGVR